MWCDVWCGSEGLRGSEGCPECVVMMWCGSEGLRGGEGCSGCVMWLCGVYGVAVKVSVVAVWCGWCGCGRQGSYRGY